jgi:hypothetical protein
MENLTHYQRRVLDKLLPPLKKIEPYVELLRVSLLFRQIKEIESDRVLFDLFKTIINNQLCFHLKSLDEFYDLDKFKDDYEKLVKQFIDENIDADKNDFIEKYISSQNEIIDKTFKYFIKIDSYESLELIQFVESDFFDEFVFSSKKKITFLKDETLRIKNEFQSKRITLKNKKILNILERVNLEIEFLREDVAVTDFINVLIEASKEEIHLNIDNRSFYYLLSKIKEYFFNFSYTAVAKTNKIYSKGGTLMKAKTLRNSKSDCTKHKDNIDRILNNFI